MYALYGGVAVMALLLWATGAAVLRLRWPPRAVVALSVALYLLTAVLLLPMTVPACSPRPCSRTPCW